MVRTKEDIQREMAGVMNQVDTTQVVNMPPKPTTIRGRVVKINFSSPGFSAGYIKTNDGKVSFSGKGFVRESDTLILTGKWTRHPTYGDQFQFKTLEYDTNLDGDGLIKYLTNNPDFKGIGIKKAQAIVKEFGTNFETALLETPKLVASVAKVPMATIENIASFWVKNKTVNNAMAKLSSFELTFHQVKTLVDKFGSGVVGVIQENPFRLMKEIKGFAFKKIDVIAMKLGTSKEQPARLEAGVLHTLDEQKQAGHTFTEFDDLIELANMVLILDGMNSKKLIHGVVVDLIRNHQLAVKTIDGARFVADPKLLSMEEDLAGWFALGSNIVSRDWKNFKSLDYLNQEAQQLNKLQFNAVVESLSKRIFLLSGGAGVGKTFTINIIADVFRECKFSVTLCAPTGKAAKRIEESTGLQASTIHRLLGFDGQTWTYNSENNLTTDVVIVDEVSMVDVELAWRLFDAIDLSKTSVILVGDHNQLPPVGPGNILRDLIKSRAIPTVVLTEVIRQAGLLKLNSVEVLTGKVVTQTAPDEWYVVNNFSDVENIKKFIFDCFESRLEARGFHPLDDVQVLTPTHKGPLGTVELNGDLQRILQKKFYKVDVVPVAAGRKPKFYKGDKVLWLKNNYKLKVMNGATGRVLDVGPKGVVTVQFEEEEIEIKPGTKEMGQMALAYALTIHKTQGSEYPCVLVVCHKSHSYQHHRNLLYTAVTRAKKTVMVIGDKWGIMNCAKKRQVDSRRTFLNFFLRKGD